MGVRSKQKKQFSEKSRISKQKKTRDNNEYHKY
jgi:hypothetical protein